MEIKKGNRIKYDDSIYLVAAVVLSTLYLTAVNDEKSHYDYDISEVYKKYHNIELLNPIRKEGQ